ncbi:MAG TPA: STAS domain-containing protein [Acidimicrobiales bacterium]|nr:STAS domain-containing protein [Acidimicrobiales bacterium]
MSADGGTPIVSLRGELDLLSRDRVHDYLVELTEPAPPRLVLDLAGLTFVDSSGLNVFALIHKRMQSYGGVLEAQHMTESVQKVMEISGLASLLRHPSSQAEPSGRIAGSDAG